MRSVIPVIRVMPPHNETICTSIPGIILQSVKTAVLRIIKLKCDFAIHQPPPKCSSTCYFAHTSYISRWGFARALRYSVTIELPPHQTDTSRCGNKIKWAHTWFSWECRSAQIRNVTLVCWCQVVPSWKLSAAARGENFQGIRRSVISR